MKTKAGLEYFKAVLNQPAELVLAASHKQPGQVFNLTSVWSCQSNSCSNKPPDDLSLDDLLKHPLTQAADSLLDSDVWKKRPKERKGWKDDDRKQVTVGARK